MTPTLVIILLWVAFTVTHTVPAGPRVRARLVERLGLGGYLGLYSLVSLALFVPLVLVWVRHLHEGPPLWNLRDLTGVRPLAQALAGIGLAGMVASFFQPSPFALGAPERPEPYGLTRITRHPLFLPAVPLACGHLLMHGWATDVAFFGGLALYAVIGCWHQDRRKRVTEGERLAAYFAQSSLVPFAAILAGRGRLALGELPWLGLAVGAATAWGVYRLHPVLFG